MKKIETGVSAKGCLSGLSGIVFSIWGFVLNTSITGWLMSTHHDFSTAPTPQTLIVYLTFRSCGYFSSFLGIILGFITGYVVVSKDCVLARRLGWFSLILIVGLAWLGLPKNWRLVFDACAFSALWALLLIAVGTLLKPKTQKPRLSFSQKYFGSDQQLK